NHALIGATPAWKSEMRFLLIPIVLLLLTGLVWFGGIRPFVAELEHFKYKMALGQGKNKKAEKFLLKAIDYDPHNSAYCLYASQFYKNTMKDLGKARDFIEKAIVDFNGDVTGWSVYYMKGLLAYRTGSLFEARAAFEKALYYNPTFERARKKLEQVNKVIRDHDKVLIKLR
ncbi:MAG: tetratricopeptide repeat protein, partial [Desulfobacteraceae bacterium]